MGMSAAALGREFGRTAREMNALLKEYGYLGGEPNAYGLTEKGQQYGVELSWDNGYGGYAYRAWETRTWNDKTAAALRADMEGNPGGFAREDSPAEEADAIQDTPVESYDRSCHDHDGGGISWKVYAAIGGAAVVVCGVRLAPRVKPFWNDKVKPAAKKVRDRFTMREPDDAQTFGSPERDPE